MPSLGIARVRRWMMLVAVGVVCASVIGCSTTSYSRSVEQLLADSEDAHGAVKISGIISTEPTRTGEGTIFFVADEVDPDERVAVVTSELPSVPDDRGPKGYVDRLVIVTGNYDGRVIQSEDLLLKTYGTYQSPEGSL